MSVTLLIACLASDVNGQANTRGAPQKLKEGLATFHIGNSLTDTTGKFADFVRTAGIAHKYQSFTAGGHLTWQLWENQLPRRQKEWDAKLAGYKRIDHFTVQPRDFTKNNVDHEAEYAIRFFEVIRKHSPQVQSWFYAEWVEKNRGRPTDQGRIPSRQMKQTFPAHSWEESMAAMLLYNEDLQAKVLETYKEGKRPRVLPSCLAMGWIKNMIDAGQLPDAKKGSFYPLLFSDDVHPNAKGGYLVDLTWYAAFYRESPEGKVLPTGTGLTEGQATVMQKLAWEVVKNYPDCGLYEEGSTAVAVPEFVTHGESAAGKTQAVTLVSQTPGAWFRYTLDGTVPTRTRGYVYCGVINMPVGNTLKAIAFKSGMADSAVTEIASDKKTK
jgi:Chitobiase/beta-hexosaminidase C-terminal domain